MANTTVNVLTNLQVPEMLQLGAQGFASFRMLKNNRISPAYSLLFVAPTVLNGFTALGDPNNFGSDANPFKSESWKSGNLDILELAQIAAQGYGCYMLYKVEDWPGFAAGVVATVLAILNSFSTAGSIEGLTVGPAKN